MHVFVKARRIREEVLHRLEGNPAPGRGGDRDFNVNYPFTSHGGHAVRPPGNAGVSFNGAVHSNYSSMNVQTADDRIGRNVVLYRESHCATSDSARRWVANGINGDCAYAAASGGRHRGVFLSSCHLGGYDLRLHQSDDLRAYGASRIHSRVQVDVKAGRLRK